MLSPEGLTIALSNFLSLTLPAPVQRATPAVLQRMEVHSSTQEVRPFVACAILRDVAFTPRVFDSFIKYQDKLHKTLCKQRALASIGTHDLDTVAGPFLYSAEEPSKIVFRALNQPAELTAEDLFTELEKDLFLRAYLPIVREHAKYPVIRDREGRVCSLPPIINGEHSKITL